MSGVTQAVFMNQRSFGAPPGQQAYTTAGTYSWIAPAGVTSISFLIVSPGGSGQGISTSGGGGGLAYKNSHCVTPGNSYSIVIPSPSTGVGGNTSAFCITVRGGGGDGTPGQLISGSASASYVGGAGGVGYGGGGAAGYSGNGGAGGTPASGGVGQAGTGGAGGGGAGTGNGAGGGGGVELLGQGANGAGGLNDGGFQGGGGGSGGSAGGRPTFICLGYCCITQSTGGLGGSYGGGSGMPFTAAIQRISGVGGPGAVRIIWPGNTRSFPSTCTGNL